MKPHGLEHLVGRTVHGHRLGRVLGRGGMSVVFWAENEALEEDVKAFKVILPELAREPEFVERFKREARLLRRLEHPAIVRFYDFAQPTVDGAPLLVLELLEGQSLREWTERAGPRGDLDEVLRMLAEAAEGVGFAHDREVIHRDLKPENLFRTKSGAVKILDLGIARVTAEVESTRKLTQAGVAPGTVLYLAPELAENQAATTASDVYALGLVLFEALTGQHPLFAPGESMTSAPAVLLKHVRQRPTRLEALRPEAPAALAELVERCLAKDPRQRPANGAALGRELRSILAEREKQRGAQPPATVATELRLPGFEEVGAFPAPPAPADGKEGGSGRRYGVVLVAAVGVLLAGGILGLRSLRSRSEDRGATTAAVPGVRPPAPPPPAVAALPPAPPAPPALPVAERPAEMDPWATEEIDRQFAEYRPQIGHCMQRFPAQVASPRLEALQFDVDTRGQVVRASLVPSAAAEDPLGECLLRVARGALFHTRGQELSFRIPIEIR